MPCSGHDALQPPSALIQAAFQLASHLPAQRRGDACWRGVAAKSSSRTMADGSFAPHLYGADSQSGILPCYTAIWLLHEEEETTKITPCLCRDCAPFFTNRGREMLLPFLQRGCSPIDPALALRRRLPTR